MDRRPEHTDCPWCGEEFEDENERGVHISKNHVNPEPIPQPDRKRNTNDNLMDEWDTVEEA